MHRQLAAGDQLLQVQLDGVAVRAVHGDDIAHGDAADNGIVVRLHGSAMARRDATPEAKVHPT